jgi:rubrerythrin
MIGLELQTFVFLFLTAGLAFVFGLWIYYDRRDRVLYDQLRSKRTYHCVKCGHLYAVEAGFDEVTHCPHCRFENSRLKF